MMMMGGYKDGGMMFKDFIERKSEYRNNKCSGAYIPEGSVSENRKNTNKTRKTHHSQDKIRTKLTKKDC
jgi:hypothetical protein